MLMRPGLSENQSTVLRHVRSTDGISRVALVERTGLSSGAITRITRELLLMGCIEEGERQRSRRGQPPKMLRIAPDGGYAFGLSFGVRCMEFVLCDFKGTILHRRERPLSDPDPERVAAHCAEEITALNTDLGLPPERVLGLGIAVPAMFGEDCQLITSSWFAAWQQNDVGTRFATEVNLPVQLVNTGTAAAMAENMFGEARNEKISFTLYLSHGIGGGLVVDGAPYRGQHGNACEVSMMFPASKGSRPSLQDLEAALAKAHNVPPGPIDYDTLLIRGDTALLRWIDRATGEVRELLRQIQMLYDPGAIVLAGRLPEAILRRIHFGVTAEKIDPGVRSPEAKILLSRLGPKVAALGAASQCILQIVAR